MNRREKNIKDMIEVVGIINIEVDMKAVDLVEISMKEITQVYVFTFSLFQNANVFHVETTHK